MGPIFNEHPVCFVFGLHTKQSIDNSSIMVFDSDDDEHIYANMVTVASWFPGISIVSTIVKLFFTYKTIELEYVLPGREKDEKEIAHVKTFIRAYTIRAILDIFLGPLFFIIDMIVTLGRFLWFKAKKTDAVFI